ncbi:MAG: DNA polymerase III subunit chi [Planctomycetes bacterium]|nr:DNA polymerase III subunit chi [Planctomycetota bacterium]
MTSAEQQPERTAEFIKLASPQQKRELICIRAAFCYEQGKTVSVYAPDPDEAAALDVALWTFRQELFVPHVRLEQAHRPMIEPVVIFSEQPGETTSDVLILASAEALPDWAVSFPHIYDFAPVYDEELRASARARFNACKEAGYHMRFIEA